MLNKFSALLQITRPANCAIGGLSIFIAAAIAVPHPIWPQVWFAALSGILITAAANVINDWFDVEIDRINRPDRVLPSEKLSLNAALWWSIILFAAGVFFSIFVTVLGTAIAALSSILLIFYSAKLKRTAFWGNLAVSLVTGAAFIYGASAAGDWRAGVIPAIFAALFHFGREVLKDLEDVAGDAALAAQTIPIRYGRRSAMIIITCVYILLIVTTIIPFATGIYNLNYLLVVLPGVGGVLLGVIFILWTQRENANLRLLSQILKADMLVGLLAIYLGQDF